MCEREVYAEGPIRDFQCLIICRRWRELTREERAALAAAWGGREGGREGLRGRDGGWVGGRDGQTDGKKEGGGCVCQRELCVEGPIRDFQCLIICGRW